MQQRTEAQLESLGVEVCCGTVLWAAAVAASLLGAKLGAPLDRAGRVNVNPNLALPGHPEVFVAGDPAALSRPDGHPVPGVAPAANQVGTHRWAARETHVARSLRTHLAGGSAQSFVYADYGNLPTIGRMAALVDLRGFQFPGLLAWWF